MPTPTTQERLSACIQRYQACNKPHTVDVSGVVAKVQALERAFD